MNNIEKLAIEHLIIDKKLEFLNPFTGSVGKNQAIVLERLTAFAKALQQSSEPVAIRQVYEGKTQTWLDATENYYKQVVADKSAMVRIVFTLPPASVPLEKYNKLENELDIAKDVLEAHTLTHVYDKLIAEAEGKDG